MAFLATFVGKHWGSNQLEPIQQQNSRQQQASRIRQRFFEDHSLLTSRKLNQITRSSTRKMTEAAEDTRAPLIAARERGNSRNFRRFYSKPWNGFLNSDHHMFMKTKFIGKLFHYARSSDCLGIWKFKTTDGLDFFMSFVRLSCERMPATFEPRRSPASNQLKRNSSDYLFQQ